MGVVLLALLLAGGWLASGRLTRAEAKSDSGPFVLETTVERLVTVRERGKLVKKLVPVVRRMVVRSTRMQFGTQIVTEPGRTHLIRESVVKYVPRVRERVVRVNGKTRTINETRLVPVTTVQTRTQTTTNQQTVTDQRTVTERQTDVRTAVVTETAPPRTVTQTPPPETVTVTETVTRTETLPSETVTITVTLPTP